MKHSLKMITILFGIMGLFAFPLYAAQTDCPTLSGEETYADLADEAYNARNYDDAYVLFSCEIEQGNPEAETYNMRANSSFGSGLYDQAIPDYTTALSLVDPTDISAFVVYSNNRANTYLNLRDYKAALADFSTVVVFDPTHAGAHNGRGNANYYADHFVASIDDYSRAIEANSENGVYWTNRGIAYYWIGDLDAAMSDYTEAIRIAPNYARAYNERGWLLYTQEEYEAAVDDFTQAITINSSSTQYHYNRGDAYFQLGEFDLALDDFATILELNPGSYNAYARRGNVFFEQGDNEAALEAYETYLEMAGRNADATIVERVESLRDDS